MAEHRRSNPMLSNGQTWYVIIAVSIIAFLAVMSLFD
jgi:hypothetical protein